MAHEVIMPALGMAQTSGVIVSWLKAQGDAVAEGDPLMEVETDKAVMEVAALASGFLVEIRHPAGADVPVGEVVALIGASPAEGAAPAPVAAPPSGATAPAPASASPSSADAGAPVPVPAVRSPAPAPARKGQVLASPKARRLAEARGIDLRQVVAQGGREPLHAADIESFRSAVAGVSSGSEIVAELDAGPVTAFRAWLRDQAPAIGAHALWAALAASALGKAAVIRVETPGYAGTFALPPRAGLASLIATEADDTPDLILRDLTGSRITRARLESDHAPVLSVVGQGDRLTLTLSFTASQLSDDSALALIEGFAARAEDPMRLLL